jgi:hypothetical protein
LLLVLDMKNAAALQFRRPRAFSMPVIILLMANNVIFHVIDNPFHLLNDDEIDK